MTSTHSLLHCEEPPLRQLRYLNIASSAPTGEHVSDPLTILVTDLFGFRGAPDNPKSDRLRSCLRRSLSLGR